MINRLKKAKQNATLWWKYGENWKMPNPTQIYDPKTKQVKDPQQCNLILIRARRIFEDADRLVSPVGGATGNPTFGITVEKTFVPHMSIERHTHQMYLYVDALEIYTPDGNQLLEKLLPSTGVLITQPQPKQGEKQA